MQIEDVKPNKPNFGLVVVLFAVTILVIAVVATVLVTWRAKEAKKTPFTKHPLSLMMRPGQPAPVVTS